MISRVLRLMKDLSVAEVWQRADRSDSGAAKTNSTGSPPLVCSATGHSEILSNWYLREASFTLHTDTILRHFAGNLSAGLATLPFLGTHYFFDCLLLKISSEKPLTSRHSRRYWWASSEASYAHSPICWSISGGP